VRREQIYCDRCKNDVGSASRTRLGFSTCHVGDGVYHLCVNCIKSFEKEFMRAFYGAVPLPMEDGPR
jgi:hypothetical protein